MEGQRVAVRFPERFPVRISTGIPGEIEWSVRLSSKALHVPCRFHTPLVPLAFIFCAFNFPGNPALKEEVTSLLRREGRMKEEVRLLPTLKDVKDEGRILVGSRKGVYTHEGQRVASAISRTFPSTDFLGNSGGK